MSNYIPCTFSDGMLPSEYLVKIHEELSLFVPREFVLGEEDDGLLEVEIIDVENNVIQLPAPIFNDGRQYIEFPIESLKSA